MSEKRPKDLIDAVQQIAAKHGHFQEVDEEYYQSFLDLTAADLERLTIVMMLNHEQEVRRLSAGLVNPGSIKAVANLVVGTLRIMSMGLGTLDAFATFGMTARIGPEPSPKTSEQLDEFWEAKRSVIEDAVSRSLAWLLSQQNRQSQLPI